MDIGAKKIKTYNGTEIFIYRKTALCTAADLALRMIERWGVVACENDGEDSAGRQKLRMLSENDVVQRACRIAELSMTKFNKRGWVMDLPEPTVKDDDA